MVNLVCSFFCLPGGILDVDLCVPSIPRIMNVEGKDTSVLLGEASCNKIIVVSIA